MCFCDIWRGALTPDPSSVVWHTVGLASLHCRYLAATHLPPLPNVWLVNPSGGCSLFALLKLQTVHARPTSPGHLYPPPPLPFTVTPKVVFLSFISVSVCLLHVPCGCARVYARVRRGKKWQLRATRWQRCSLLVCKLFFLHRKWC